MIVGTNLYRFYAVTRQVVASRDAGQKICAAPLTREGGTLRPRGPGVMAAALPLALMPAAELAACRIFGEDFIEIEAIPAHILN